MSMRVTHIRIRNVLGIEELDIKPGTITLVQGENGCLAADTYIDVPRDLSTRPMGVKIQSLVGTRPIVYAYDTARQRIVLARAAKVWKTSECREVTRIRLKAGRGRFRPPPELVGTPDHRVMLLGGGYVPLGELRPGDRLMPLYRRCRDGVYAAVLRNDGELQAEHRLIAEFLCGRALSADVHVHHRDHNPFNNSPANLVAMEASAHLSLHGRLRPPTYEEHPRGMAGRRHTAETRRQIALATRRAVADPGVRRRMSIASRRTWARRDRPWADPSRLEDLYLRRRLSTVQIGDVMGCSSTCVRRWLHTHGIPVRSASEAQVARQPNHQVVSIEPAGRAAVYDIEVPGLANFVANGVVVHNSGKTSVIEALKALVKGGHDATLLRRGAEEGEIVLVLENGMEVTKRITPSKSSLEALHPEFGRISAAQTWLRGLTDRMSVNPVGFLAAKDRVRTLLEAMPIEPDWAAISAALDGVLEGFAPQLPDGAHALDALAVTRKAVYDERTGVNRVAKEARTHAGQLQGSLPAAPDGDVPEAGKLAAERRRREKLLIEGRAAADLEAEKRIREIDRKAEKAIREIERKAERARARLRAEAEAKKGDLEVEHRPAINRLGADIAAARERRQAEALHENTRRVLAGETEKAEAAEQRSKALTEALARLDGLEGRLLADLPIPGVSVRDGEIYRDDIPFARLNRAAQVKIAVAVARLRAGEVPLVCMDGLECLDAETFRLFVEELATSELQAIVTRVTDTPFSVQTIGADS